MRGMQTGPGISHVAMFKHWLAAGQIRTKQCSAHMYTHTHCKTMHTAHTHHMYTHWYRDTYT